MRTHRNSPKQTDSWRGDEGIAAWSAFLRAHAAAVPAIDRDVSRATGVPLAWYDVLLELNAAPGRQMRMQDLGDAVVLSRSRVSRVVDELVAAGYVRRDANPTDGRSSLAVMTAAGRAAFRRTAPVYLDAIRRHFVDRLPPSTLPVLRRALEQVAGPYRAPRARETGRSGRPMRTVTPGE